MFRPTQLLILFLLIVAIPEDGLCQSWSIGHVSRTYVDSSRGNRAIPSEIYYPALVAGDDVPVATDIFPVLSMGHGFVMTINAYANFWKALVPRGYIVIIPNTETGTSPSHTNLGLDLAFVIMQMKRDGLDSSDLFFAHLSPTSAVMGHSMGGGASFLAAAGNPDITAIVNFAAAITNPSSIAAATQIVQPALLFAGSEDCVTPSTQHQLPMYDSLSSPCKSYVSITGGGHCYFADYNFLCTVGENLCFPNLTITREEQHSTTFDLLIPWLDCMLKAEHGACADFQDSILTSARISYQQSCSVLGTALQLKNECRCEVYPNPFKEKAMIDCHGPLYSVEIFDLIGTRKLFLTNHTGDGHVWVDTSHLPPGVYLIRLTNSDGKQQTIKGIRVL